MKALFVLLMQEIIHSALSQEKFYVKLIPWYSLGTSEKSSALSTEIAHFFPVAKNRPLRRR